jgi:hypothetical protein
MLEDAERIRRAQVGPLNFGVLSRYVITLPTPGEVYPPKVVTTPEAPPTQAYPPPEVVTIPVLPPTPPPPPPPLEVWEKIPEVEVKPEVITTPEAGLGLGLLLLMMLLMAR